MKNKRFILLLLLAATLTGCSTQGKNSDNIAKQQSKETSVYLPIEPLWKGTSQPIQSILGDIHSIKMKNVWVETAVPNSAIIVASPAENSDPDYPDGLYSVDANSGKVTALFSVDASKFEQINLAAADQQWLVYEFGTDSGDQNTWGLYAYNFETKESQEIYAVPEDFLGEDEPSGLTVEGDQCIWSDFIENKASHNIISEIHDDDLANKTDNILFQANTDMPSDSTTSDTSYPYDPRKGIIYASSVRDGKLVFSVNDNVNPMDTSAAGDIYELDLGTKQLSHMIHLYHAANPICSYGDQVVLDDNYDPIPNSPKNPAPYPVYLYKKGDKCIYRLSPDKADFSPPSQNERFIAWQSSYVYDLKTGTYYTVPGRFSYIVGDYLTWADRQNGILYWAQLPN